jgi:hypothetical protein
MKRARQHGLRRSRSRPAELGPTPTSAYGHLRALDRTPPICTKRARTDALSCRPVADSGNGAFPHLIVSPIPAITPMEPLQPPRLLRHGSYPPSRLHTSSHGSYPLGRQSPGRGPCQSLDRRRCAAGSGTRARGLPGPVSPTPPGRPAVPGQVGLGDRRRNGLCETVSPAGPTG